MNKVILMGNLGADPEMKVTQGGMSVMRLRLATNERKKDGEQWVDHTEWHTVTVFGKRAEGLAKVLTRGSKLLVDGVLRTHSWEDKDTGKKRFATEVIANDVELAGDRPQQQGQQRPPPQQRPQRPQQQPDTSFNYGANATDGGGWVGGDDDPMSGYTGG